METEQNKENFSLSSDFNTDSYLGSDRVIDSDLQRYSSNIEELNSNNDASTSRGSINLRENQEICVNCSFWRVHPGGFPNQHKTCICELFASNSICCLEGYSNLAWQIPYIMLYAPTPNKYIYHTVIPYTFPIQINNNHVIEIVNIANSLKQNIIPKLKFPYKNQTYIINNA